jgi:hypothetical protein
VLDETTIAADERAALREMRDEYEIRRLITSLGSSGDRYDADASIDCYHPDAIDEHGERFRGNAHNFIRWGMDPGREGAAQILYHSLTNFRIEVHGDVAASQTYVVATHVRPVGSRLKVGWFGGRYLDRLERRDGGPWKIAYRRAVLDWDLEVDHVAAYPGDMWPRGVRSTDDQSFAMFDRVARGLPWPENPVGG